MPCTARALDLPVRTLLETSNPRYQLSASSSGRPRPMPGPRSWHDFLLLRYTAPELSGSLDPPTSAPHVHSFPVHSRESSAAGPIRTPGHGFALLHASFSMHAEQPVWIAQTVLIILYQNKCRRSVRREMLKLAGARQHLAPWGTPASSSKPAGGRAWLLVS